MNAADPTPRPEHPIPTGAPRPLRLVTAHPTSQAHHARDLPSSDEILDREHSRVGSHIVTTRRLSGVVLVNLLYEDAWWRRPCKERPEVRETPEERARRFERIGREDPRVRAVRWDARHGLDPSREVKNPKTPPSRAEENLAKLHKWFLADFSRALEAVGIHLATETEVESFVAHHRAKVAAEAGRQGRPRERRGPKDEIVRVVASMLGCRQRTLEAARKMGRELEAAYDRALDAAARGSPFVRPEGMRRLEYALTVAAVSRARDPSGSA